jgi:tRNA uridine 5-carboxymethylaminomethyl modification enzyme
MLYDIIVIGAGHAGIEAASASARMGCATLLLTLDAKTVGAMSCNPAIGGVGKGQLVKEIDALGGQMAKAADACAIQFRMLNASKGAAVQSSRAQIDMYAYNRYMNRLARHTRGLEVREAEVKSLIVENGAIAGVVTDRLGEVRAKGVVLCSGTFLDGVIHVGMKHQTGGRFNEPAALGLAADLKKLGFSLLRFKTGTCARLDKNSIDFSRLQIQEGDKDPIPFSFSNVRAARRQVPCYITYTNPETHKIICSNLGRSPLYAGKIKSTGVRYCPSIEDKAVKFADKDRHQVFLEPQGIGRNEIYANGLSTSLPEDVQLDFIHTIEGLRKARVLRFGYGIEHTVSEPTQNYPTLETKLIRNLYFAGQINGTTGYEEAAAQGLIAGINAALRVQGKEPFVLERSTSYIGVLLDDLTTKGTNEPYRMFTSRVEYRLLLREDNADLRLSGLGYKLGLVGKAEFKKVQEKKAALDRGFRTLRTKKVNSFGSLNLNNPATLEAILKRPEISIRGMLRLLKINESAGRVLESEVKYAGFIQRQLKDVERFKHLEKVKLAPELDYLQIPSLSREIKEKLSRVKPLTLGQASRISGVTPAAVSMLMVYLKRYTTEGRGTGIGKD